MDRMHSNSNCTCIVNKILCWTPTVVQMDSMYPTLKQGERLVLNRIPRTRKQLPKRGDIITFEQPSVTYIERIK